MGRMTLPKTDLGAQPAWRRHLPFIVSGVLALLVIGTGVMIYAGRPLPPPMPVDVALPAPTSPVTAPPAAPPATTAKSAPIPAAAAAPVPAPPPVATLVTPSAPAQTIVPTQGALPPAPDPELITRGQYGFVPVAHGPKLPWKTYARPVDPAEKRPKLALIIVGLGLSASSTDAAIEEMGPNVTLAFAPFARRLGQWMNLARATGHETLLELPMEPLDYPRQDPGYNALLTAYQPAQNLDRLSWVMSQAVGYTGLIGRMGGRFESSEDAMQPILKDIAERGLLFVDNRATAQSIVPRLAAPLNLPSAAVTHMIDLDPSGPALDRALGEVEAAALRDGVTVATATASKSTLARLAQWTKSLDARGIALAPISAVVGQTPVAAAEPEPPPENVPVAPPASAGHE